MGQSSGAGRVSADELARLEQALDLPHVVILGAGASLAAFPSGDLAGRSLPLMANMAGLLGLSNLLKKHGLDPEENFESLYSRLHEDDPSSDLICQIEQQVCEYFSRLRLPDYPTLYDLLLLSLREKDAVFTFNWDPFLADTYARHDGLMPLPQIFHLHGNVRMMFCQACKQAVRRPDVDPPTMGDVLQALKTKQPGTRDTNCPACGCKLTPTQLLYPVAEKNYDDPFISSQWSKAHDYLSRAFILTIFGYGAPESDKKAKHLLLNAWKKKDYESISDRVEIIDIEPSDALAERWEPFPFHGHYDTCRSFFQSWLARYPRRSCEALYHIGIEGKATEPLPWIGNMRGLCSSIKDLTKYERQRSR